MTEAMNEHNSLDANANKDYGHSSFFRGSIELPENAIFKDLHNGKRFALDIGGSLAKIAYISEEDARPKHCNENGSIITPDASSSNGVFGVENGAEEQPIVIDKKKQKRVYRLHLATYEVKSIERCLDFVRMNILEDGREIEDNRVRVTGGGAHRYEKRISTRFGMKLDQLNEFNCIVTGTNFLLKNVPQECFSFEDGDEQRKHKYSFQNFESGSVFPYLLVTIGTGVSIIKVMSDNDFEILGGVLAGGATFNGLGSLLTNAKSFDELLALAADGHSENVDLLVKDIYGSDCTNSPVPLELITSSFGKAARASIEDIKGGLFKSSDIAKSLLHMISLGIGQVSKLHARAHGLKRVVFGGSFIRGQPFTMRTINFSFNFMKSQEQALFLMHEGYVGAVGAFLCGVKGNANMSGRFGSKFDGINREESFHVDPGKFDTFSKDDLIKHVMEQASQMEELKKKIEDLLLMLKHGKDGNASLLSREKFAEFEGKEELEKGTGEMQIGAHHGQPMLAKNDQLSKQIQET